MPSRVDIVNHALTKLGEERIIALSDEVAAARHASAVFDLVLEGELQANSWAFSMRRASLAASATAPVWGYDFAYPVPANFIHLFYVDGQEENAGRSEFVGSWDPVYRVEGRQIVTNLAGPLKIIYTAMIEDPNEWDPGFRNAFAIKLAEVLCDPVTQNTTKKQLLEREYASQIALSKQRTAIQNPPTQPRDGTWLQARLD